MTRRLTPTCCWVIGGAETDDESGNAELGCRGGVRYRVQYSEKGDELNQLPYDGGISLSPDRPPNPRLCTSAGRAVSIQWYMLRSYRIGD